MHVLRANFIKFNFHCRIIKRNNRLLLYKISITITKTVKHYTELNLLFPFSRCSCKNNLRITIKINENGTKDATCSANDITRF